MLYQTLGQYCHPSCHITPDTGPTDDHLTTVTTDGNTNGVLLALKFLQISDVAVYGAMNIPPLVSILVSCSMSSNNNTIIYDNYIILTRRYDVMKYEYLMVEKLMSSILAISTLSFNIFYFLLFIFSFDLLKIK